MKLICLLLFTVAAYGATITSAGSGGWSSTSTWTGGVVPGNGDVAVIANGHTVTVSDARTVGTSGVAGTIAVNLNASGVLSIASGGVLTVRGDIRYTAGSGNTADALLIAGGGTLEFDGSVSAVAYVFGPSAAEGYRPVRITGTSGSHAFVRSVSGGPNGRFGLNGYGQAGSFIATYAEFLRIGDASNPSIDVAYNFYDAAAIRYDVTHSLFTSCGNPSMNYVPENGFYRHSWNTHVDSMGTNSLNLSINLDPIGTSGTRVVNFNVFDKLVGAFRARDFEFCGNYFGDAFDASGTTEAWSRFVGNFIRTTATTDGSVSMISSSSDGYMFTDMSHGNPRGFYNKSVNMTHTRWIIGFGGNSYAIEADSGEFLALSGSITSATTWGMTGSIFLPDIEGYQPYEAIGLVGTLLDLHPDIRYNTFFSGRKVSTGVSNMIQISEGGNNALHQIGAFSGNLIWNPALPGYIADGVYKIFDQNPSSPQVDVCDPAVCDYNGGWNVTNSSGRGAMNNEGKGYSSNWSVTPGAHDVDANPQFIDYVRTVELFDSKYLGNHPAAWSSGATYSVGDFVSNTRADLYWSTPVNFRYINGPGCSSANPEPGNGDSWRACWEWASLYRLRQGISAGTKYDDQLIGAHNEDVIQTMMKWIRHGYAPTNPAYSGTGPDGTDIGAVPVLFPAR